MTDAQLPLFDIILKTLKETPGITVNEVYNSTPNVKNIRRLGEIVIGYDEKIPIGGNGYPRQHEPIASVQAILGQHPAIGEESLAKKNLLVYSRELPEATITIPGYEPDSLTMEDRVVVTEKLMFHIDLVENVSRNYQQMRR